MGSKPTIQELNEIARQRIILNMKIVSNNLSPIIGSVTPYGEELLEDIEALLSIIPHQTFVENSIREFQSKIAQHILVNS